MSDVTVRFAPSPTGSLHIGGARTALYNWLYARHCGGKFLLRIEDTDKERSTPENIRIILDGMRWMGLDWDGEPVMQSERIGIHRPLIERLIDEGGAYRCTCTKDELDAKREAAQAEKRKYLYDRKCRDAGHGPDCGEHVVRLKMPVEGEIVVKDLILGDVTFNAAELDDWIIARSDHSPTYNFVVVADDHDMGVTHVIRGNDHLNNTPKQLVVYQALGFDIPAFAHIPMVHGPDGKKLSKRHGASAVTELREMGLLPEAVRNYLARLGWSHGDQELFTDAELIEHFDVANVNASATVMDFAKLEWINQQKILAMTPDALAERLLPYLIERGYSVEAGPWLTTLAANIQERFKNLVEMADHVRYFFEEPSAYDEAAVKKWFKADTGAILNEIADGLEALDPFDEAGIEGVINGVVEKHETKLGKVAQPIRIAVTGSSISPGIFETLALLDKERSVARIRKAAAHATQHQAEKQG
ncbi:MAG: glutamate--tRNA ligase [Deltaproteobacteria bacterium]|nr:glutamate--tRNA ligase [Deltaproteobacteria bacterium]